MDGSDHDWLGPGEIARRLGLTRKALRVYEREGLVAPQRLESGWRVYGPVEAARLHQIIVLRELGIPLRSIKNMLDSPDSSLAATLLLQRKRLEQQEQRTRKALALIRDAQAKLDRRGTLALDDLTGLTRETTMSTRMTQFEEKLEGVLAERDPAGESIRRVRALQARVREAAEAGRPCRCAGG